MKKNAIKWKYYKIYQYFFLFKDDCYYLCYGEFECNFYYVSSLF